jgi:hypothetical protein
MMIIDRNERRQVQDGDRVSMIKLDVLRWQNELSEKLSVDMN